MTEEKAVSTSTKIKTISGLSYHPNAICEAFEQELVKEIENSPWNTSLARLTQHYGAKEYSYNRAITKIEQLKDAAPIPALFLKILDELYTQEILQKEEILDQCIVNRYLSGEGIAFHTDNINFFAEPIVS